MKGHPPPSGLAAALADRYAIEREIGAGAMATVYLAHDLRHDRKVALKVLRPELAAVLGTERFLAEIRVTAKLQHPHLLPLFDSGEADGQLFYVMPYVEGESLRVRLERERQLPVEEAIRITVAVAHALDYAHRHGVVHRDLKPENILLNEGQPLVADFGIALAVSNAGGARVTQTGISLGTPAYMSPEQATGDRVVDARSDQYSLAAVTYEMLVGDPPHHASTSQALIAKLLTERPRSVKAQRPSVPEHVDLAIEKALEKLPADRFATAGDFGETVTGKRPMLAPAGQEAAHAATARGSRTSTQRRDALLVGGTAIATAALALALASTLWPAAPTVARLTATPPTGETIGTDNPSDPDLAISADGRRIVYVGRAGGQQRLYVRGLDQLEATPLEGTEGGRTPFFSPDGRWIGYTDASYALRKIQAAGGPSVVITQGGSGPRGASWGSDDRIVYTGDSPGLLRVPAEGGEPEVLTTPDRAKGEMYHALPEVLPGARAVLFTVRTAGGSRVEALDLASGERRVLVQGGSHPRYAASGHLIYAVQGTLQAVAFDAKRLEVGSDPAPVLEDVVTKPQTGAANYALSEGGALVYHSGGALVGQRTLVWVDRQGREEPVGAPPRAFGFPRVSPDGSRVAVHVADQDHDIWVWDLARKTLTRLTFGPPVEAFPVWSPDGRDIVFQSQRDGSSNLFAQAADGTGAAERLTQGGELKQTNAYAPDGRALLFRQTSAANAGDIYRLRMDGGWSSEPLIATPADELNAEISPDGRWLAYQSSESGRYEIYVRPYPSVDAGIWQVSTGGGTHPLWAPSGRELFYLSADRRLTSVAIDAIGATFASGTPSVVLDRYVAATIGRPYDVSPDGRRFLMIKEGGAEQGATAPELVVVLNWFEELNRLAPR